MQRCSESVAYTDWKDHSIGRPFSPAERWIKTLLQADPSPRLHLMAPTFTALLFAGIGSGVAHAQGTMDFSGAQTLMGTFKTFAMYAGAVICPWRSDLCWHPHDVRKISGRYSRVVRCALWRRCSRMGSWLDWTSSAATFIRWREAQGYKRLLTLTEPTYTVEQIAAKVGKTPAYITTASQTHRPVR